MFQVTFAFIVTGAIALLVEHPVSVQPRPAAVVAIVWLGLLGSGVAYLGFFQLLSRWGATRTTLVSYLLPIVGIVLGALVLHERIEGQMIVGTALVLAGIALVNSRFGRQLIFERRRAPDSPAIVGK